METRRAMGVAVKRALLVWIATAIVVLLGLVVFGHRDTWLDWMIRATAIEQQVK